MAFSDDFLIGLATKSDGFQQEFFSIMDSFYGFLEYDEEKVNAFQAYIEENFSYYEPGNLLSCRGAFVGGEATLERKDEYINEIISAIFELFQEERDYESENGMYLATHFIIAVNCPEGMMTKEEIAKIHLAFFLERQQDMPKIEVIACTPKEDYCFEYFMAIMK